MQDTTQDQDQLVQLITANYTQTFTHVRKMVHVTEDQLRQTAPNFSYTFTHVATCSMSPLPASDKTQQCLRHLNNTLNKLWVRNEAFSLMNWVFVCFSSTSDFCLLCSHSPYLP